MTDTAVQVGGLPIEVLDVPGPSPQAPLVLLHEGLGSVGLWREFPEPAPGRNGAPAHRVLALRARALVAASPSPHARVLP